MKLMTQKLQIGCPSQGVVAGKFKKCKKALKIPRVSKKSDQAMAITMVPTTAGKNKTAQRNHFCLKLFCYTAYLKMKMQVPVLCQ